MTTISRAKPLPFWWWRAKWRLADLASAVAWFYSHLFRMMPRRVQLVVAPLVGALLGLALIVGRWLP